MSVIERGGLFVLGTERHGLRRVDNQLAGRSGRQGDPGCVQFLLSLEDDLLKVFGQNKQLTAIRQAVGQGAAFRGSLISQLVVSAQKNFEEQGFAARKALMKYDSALADQRQAVFDLRDVLLEQGTLSYARSCVTQGIQQWLDRNMPPDDLPEQWNLAALKKDLVASFGLDVPLLGWVSKDELSTNEIRIKLAEVAQTTLQKLNLTEERTQPVVFDVLDEHWEDHLGALAELRENVNLKGFTGLNATFQFHNDAFTLFQSFDKELCHALACLFLKSGELQTRTDKALEKDRSRSGSIAVSLELARRWVARNDLCPCGSGQRFKTCHGKL
jgi:preprotein translocase subunit SecA